MVIVASVHCDGNLDWLSDVLMINVREGTIRCVVSFRTLLLIWSGPIVFDVLSLSVSVRGN